MGIFIEGDEIYEKKERKKEDYLRQFLLHSEQEYVITKG
jgi:hypothetical protein